jgi:hypothetical protein
MEGTEYRGRGGAFRVAVVDGIHQHRDAEGIGEEDELLSLVVAGVAGLREKPDGLKPLLLAQFDLADEVVQMPDERRHEHPQSGIGRRLQPLLDGIREVVVGEVSHRLLLCRGTNGPRSARRSCRGSRRTLAS